MENDSKAIILNVDDDDAGRYAISRTLRHAGFNVKEASNGKEALRFAEEQPDLIILDVNLPDIKGFDVCRMIKNNPLTSHIPVLHLSATFLDDESKVKGLETADGYLTQPVEPPVLIATIKALLRMKRAEKALRESKEFTENLIASMQDGFSVLDSHGVHIDVNPAFCQMTGFSREELIGVGTPHPYWPPEAYEEIEKAFKKTLRGEFGDVELTFMRKNGERFPVIVSPSWVKDKQNNVISYFATVKDITERKQAEEVLKKSEERFRTSVETLLEGFAILSAVRDSNGQIIDFKYDYINEAGCKMNQKPLEEHMGKTLLELLPTHKEIGLFDEYVRVVETGQSLTKEFLIYETVYGSGERLRQAFDVRITRLGDGFVTTWQDITDKKKGEELLRQSEERLKLLIENSKDVVIMADLEGSAMYYNGPPEYGITAEEVLGKNPFNIFEPAIAASLMNQLKLVIKSGEALTFENNIPGRGESFWFLNQMYPIRDEKGRMIAVGLIARNITERKQAEKEIQNLAKFPSENPNPVLRIARDGTLLYVNEAGLRQLAELHLQVGQGPSHATGGRLPGHGKRINTSVRYRAPRAGVFVLRWAGS